MSRHHGQCSSILFEHTSRHRAPRETLCEPSRHRTSTLHRAPQHSHPFAYGSIFCLHMGASVCKWDLAGYIFPGFKKTPPIYKWDRVPFTNGSCTQTGGNRNTKKIPFFSPRLNERKKKRETFPFRECDVVRLDVVRGAMVLIKFLSTSQFIHTITLSSTKFAENNSRQFDLYERLKQKRK
jgi:hypothetical protein